jgi:hypothetical protein
MIRPETGPRAAEVDLAHERLAVDQASHRAAGDLREEHEQHDPEQQRDRVVDAAADAEEQREDDVQHREQHQRPDDLPQVAERRAEEAQLEVGDGERPRQAPEAPRVRTQRGRPHDRVAMSSSSDGSKPTPGLGAGARQWGCRQR